MISGRNDTKRLIKKRIMTAFEWKTIFLFGESHIFVFTSHKRKSCLRHQNMSRLACIFWARYWGFVSPKLHVSTYRNQQHCWWFHYWLYIMYVLRTEDLRTKRRYQMQGQEIISRSICRMQLLCPCHLYILLPHESSIMHEVLAFTHFEMSCTFFFHFATQPVYWYCSPFFNDTPQNQPFWKFGDIS